MAYLLPWVDKQTGERKSYRFDDEHEARRMLLVLEAHDHGTERAVENVRKHYQSVYTVVVPCWHWRTSTPRSRES